MQYAVVARCPVFGGKVAGFDATKAKAVPGVKNVVQISSGVAVVADNTWSAMQGRHALMVQWDEGKAAASSTPGITQSVRRDAPKARPAQRQVGDAPGALAAAAKKIEAVYEAPYLAHAPMEPLNCVADVRADSCEVWASTQVQTAARDEAAQITGLQARSVQVHTEYMGGGFGRRGRADYIGEAVEVSKAAGVPVKLTWSREDDMQQDWYRPASLTRFAAGLDADGWPVAWTVADRLHVLRRGRAPRWRASPTSPYAIPNILVDSHNVDPGIPVSYWRSVGYSQNTFFAESFLDEMAAAGGKDPVELRRRLLANSPRLLAALELAAEKPAGASRCPRDMSRGVSHRQQYRQQYGADCRSLGREGQGAGASRGLRGGLRPGGESRGRRAADSRAASCSDFPPR